MWGGVARVVLYCYRQIEEREGRVLPRPRALFWWSRGANRGRPHVPVRLTIVNCAFRGGRLHSDGSSCQSSSREQPSVEDNIKSLVVGSLIGEQYAMNGYRVAGDFVETINRLTKKTKRGLKKCRRRFFETYCAH